MPKITFLNDPRAEADADGVTRPKSIEVPVGTSLLEAAKKIHAQVGYACGGVCACSTCHVYVKSGLRALSPQKDKEEDILDKAFDVRASSRLSCQARILAGANEDIEVEISRESRRAYFDEHPDERAAG
ncbi:MAG TPA: 2Fe-2S iron-sulfur cluster-binding protein [Pseudomonadota bacterium]|nr:2Fe-2S iron-sulfur cluster-binding protein [Pseudomonadota bacterium]